MSEHYIPVTYRLANTGSVLAAMDRLFETISSPVLGYVAVELAIDTPFTPNLNYDPDKHAFCGILSRRHFSTIEHPLNQIRRASTLGWIIAKSALEATELKRHVERELAGSAFRSAAQLHVEVADRTFNLVIASTATTAELAEYARVNADAIDKAVSDFAESIGAHLDEAAPIRLTPREIDVLTLTASGRTRDESAALLRISPATVKDHLQRASAKLGASNKTHAVALALQLGLIAP
jgi:DNA-binding CsgD family transcriptional regulator